MAGQFDALILGAGAAGLMCAIEAGKRGRRVALLERAEKIGKKILISGGGRCNFTNIHCTPEHFISANPHFVKSALARYTPKDFISLVEKHRIPYHEKTLGQLFCDRAASDITQLLEEECRAAGVQTFLNQKVLEVGKGTDFFVKTGSEEFRAPSLVVATGGLSIPKIGATSFGYELARKFGVKIQKTRPALVPLTLNAKDQRSYCELSGVSMEVVAQAGGTAFREKMLITHRGLSGPAILQASSYWEPQTPVSIDLAPGREVIPAVMEAKTRSESALRNAFLGILPKRFADRWIELHQPKNWTKEALLEFEKSVHRWEVIPSGTEGYEKAEVTAGGVDTDELSSKTMECRNVPGLFFIGEVVDVTGHLGGFNFQWAWASGAAAGRAL
ncbi:MAG: NAD(P)/FAD-dependent oxidoreductase [Acidobacteria bacterium]|nr:NAD(P)/FAD-dependent oxidoreductase [Acidobacteriota bacterium]MBS1865378.1 NAD(P)/FAD-dependent oxidoreductase [Acidobacteriota bacterium]